MLKKSIGYRERFNERFSSPSGLFLTSQMLNVTETETLAAYMKPPSRYGGPGGAGGGDDGSGGPAKGFVVRDAPWNASGNKVGHTDFSLLYNNECREG